jgi:hypothetical protein
MAKNNIIAKLQRWMDSKPGQMFLNYAYSWGASIVILGALFKITHIDGADFMLFLGMGTEVIVFFLAGFERPYDDDGKKEEIAGEAEHADVEPAVAGGTVIVGGGVPAGGTIIIGGNGGSQPEAATGESEETPVDAAQLASAIAASPIVTSPQFAGMCPEMQEATQTYVDQLNELTEILKKVAEQSARLTRDSEEMENMNRTLTGINRFYEMQLRSVSAQSATIDDVNAQTKRLASQLEELNQVYARMVEALKVNMTNSTNA